MFESLLKGGSDPSLIPYSVVNFDEVEKEHHYREALQNQLLGLCDRNGAIRVGQNSMTKETVSTGKMLFFLTGVFAQVDRNRSSKVGFSVASKVDSVDATLSKNDFADAGLTYELLGRITLILSLSNPTVDEVMEFLSSKNSPLFRYDSLLRDEGSSLVVTDDGKMAIAKRVASSCMGYRTVDNILYSLYRAHRISCSGATLPSPLVVDGKAVEAAA
jgi:ATP-dependent protease Clp ATPase subunit